MSDTHNQLQRGLKNRHIQLIALGGAIGTGLFLGSAGAIKMAGPGIILSYALVGFIEFLIMRQLGEMMTEEPVAGSFSNLAGKYWGKFAGFLSGWNYWMLYVLVGMSELSAIGIYMQFWMPELPTWQTITVVFILVNIVNLTTVKVFGELEFWFASIKVMAIIGMIVLGSYLLLSGNAGPQASITNLWTHGGFLAKGYEGIWLSIGVVLFSFGGLELIGITAAETDTPEKTIPKAVNQLIYRILIFYIGALTVLLALYPWDQITELSHVSWSEAMSASPFVKIFSKIGIPSAAHILNAVVLTAALSVYNSCVYCNSRMLYGLSLQQNAPKLFKHTNKRGVPVYAIALSSTITIAGIILNYFMQNQALGILMSLVVAALIINWAMISLTHLIFRKKQDQAGITPRFKAFGYPFTNILCLLFMAASLWILWLLGAQRSVILMPIWICCVGFCYYILKIRKESK